MNDKEENEENIQDDEKIKVNLKRFKEIRKEIRRIREDNVFKENIKLIIYYSLKIVQI